MRRKYVPFQPKDNKFRVVTVHRSAGNEVVGIHMFGPSERSLYDALIKQGPNEGFYLLVSEYQWTTTFRMDGP